QPVGHLLHRTRAQDGPVDMQPDLCPIDRKLLDGWQRDLPLSSRPFAEIGGVLGLSEEAVIDRIRRLAARGLIARVGGTCGPNTAGATTLAAVRTPRARMDEVAALIGAEPGVNHSYEREDDWNLWFVATAPDGATLAETLGRIETRTGLYVLDLPLVRPFNIDLGFGLDGPRRPLGQSRPADVSVLRGDDRPILQAMASGLPIVAQPYATLARDLGRDEADVIARIGVLAQAGILTRIGIIVRH